jgi:ATP synthase protein I
MNAEPEKDGGDSLDKAVQRRRERVELWKREGERSLGENLAMIGSLGWLIVIPALIGVFAGRWLDRTFDSGIFWTLGLLVLGVAAGSAMAWQRMFHE